MPAAIEQCAGRFEFFAPRHERPQHGPGDQDAPEKQNGQLRLGMSRALQPAVGQIDTRGRKNDHQDVGNNHHCNGEQRKQRDRTSRRDGDLSAHTVARHHTPGEATGFFLTSLLHCFVASPKGQ